MQACAEKYESGNCCIIVGLDLETYAVQAKVWVIRELGKLLGCGSDSVKLHGALLDTLREILCGAGQSFGN